jgi:hypothetical protein
MGRRVAIWVACVLGVCLAGCGGEESSSGGGSASGGGASSGAEALALGDETTLKGLSGAQMKVRVVKVEDPMKSPPAKGLVRERPKRGRRFVGVYVELTNLAKRPYRDAPLNGSVLVTDKPKASNPTILLSGKCPSKLGTRLRMPAGSSRTGCLPFQVKMGAKVTAFRFTLDSGNGPETGEWTVR